MYVFTKDAVGGVATVDDAGWFSLEHQLEVHDVTGSGVVSFKVRTRASGAYSPIVGSVDLSDAEAVRTFTVKGIISGVQAISDNAGDAFTLTVKPLE